MTPSPAPQRGVGVGEDMYRTILREIGCDNAASMDYLFDSDGDDDENNFSLLDSSSDESHVNNSNSMNNLTQKPQQGSSSTMANIVNSNHLELSHILSDNDGSASDVSLLHQWTNEWEQSPGQGVGVDLSGTDNNIAPVTALNGSDETQQDNEIHPTAPSPVPEWREKLNETQLRQQQLQQQFLHLQETQRKSSPSHNGSSASSSPSRMTTMKRYTTENGVHETPVEGQSVLSTASSAENHNPASTKNTPTMSSVTKAPVAPRSTSYDSSSPILQQIDERNKQLETNWAEQQVETAYLHNKLEALKLQFKDEQRVWKEDKTLLFSPVRRETSKIKSTKTRKTSLPSTIKSPTNRDGYPSSLPGPTTPSSQTPTSSRKSFSTKSKLTHQPDSSMMSGPLHDEDKVKLQQLVHDLKTKLEEKELHLDALQVKYDTEKQEWESRISIHQREQQLLSQELEKSKERLQDQVTQNQDLREELHELKTNGWKIQLEAAETKIKHALEQESQKAQEFQARIQALEGQHKEERNQWQNQLTEYQKRLEESTSVWKEQMEVEKDRYKELLEKHETEVNELQALLENEIGNSMPDGGISNRVDTSPRVPGPIAESSDASLAYSSVQEKSRTSESMERIDCLLEELGRMGDERIAVLNEISGEKDRRGVVALMDDNDGTTIPDDDSEIPKPVESSSGSVAGGRTDDSTMLDQTLSLLHNLKDLMECNGNGFEQEASVLETLENLSDLMQDGRSRSIILSPGRNLSAMSDAFGPDEEDRTDTSPAKLIPDSIDPWPALVNELRSRIAFLEHDRTEVARVTELIMQKERESHKIKLETAVATAKRELEEKLHMCQIETAHTIHGIYGGLCHRCQSQMYQSLK